MPRLRHNSINVGTLSSFPKNYPSNVLFAARRDQAYHASTVLSIFVAVLTLTVRRVGKSHERTGFLSDLGASPPLQELVMADKTPHQACIE